MLMMPKVNASYKHGKEKSTEILHFLTSNKDALSDDLIGDLSHIHARANSHTGITIKKVLHSENNRYLLDYCFDWSAHIGCGHTVHEDTEHHCISFKIEDTGEIRFQCFVAEARSTFEEF